MAQTKRIMISLPNTLLQEVDGIANQENINRSQLIREAMRFYINELKNARFASACNGLCGNVQDQPQPGQRSGGSRKRSRQDY